MGIFSRFADIVNSNINAILDKAEDPEKMVRLIIQEMEDTLVEVRSTSAKTLAEKKELVRRVDTLKVQVADWQEKAELALSKDRDDLARAALIEKQKSADAVAAVETELEHVESHIEKLQQEVSTLQEKLADAKARQKAIILRQRSAESRLEVKKALDSSKVEDALNRFERYENKIDGLESQIESYDLGKKSLADEIAGLQQDEKIDDELAELKKKLADKK
ncbi:phage shock protein PspA [Pseudoalteromonas sp. SSMSWG5]|jgi:phage shock protein A|uniref:phage shock protein PspA n=1 Tax=Pseudoalteromonas TaxID=53246 RepID=UPI000C60AE8D|nr:MULTISPECIES: phage shock protein PspA [unclassified Pseudoalteromonas]MBD56210.1 phage shock protein PspA [Pseudoalteromonas sp.]MCF2899257.1 phage shock protein PspA [Pseudoalteromonas sp. OFAV1]MCF2919406.1 phage shock protein PspA [Pseudoalteromonas sp. APAL1]MCO7248383.1 phage shock protein PspA [Pseudoalteromonas sp. Ps84H-4]TGV20031.1 phage shock protein PspA [Pseudoalteromonas sp. MEBiC 03607]|tara:strand:+ start:122 stop:784 length:663 start_codon:yes stop_codon:yes gene_type:complete